MITYRYNFPTFDWFFLVEEIKELIAEANIFAKIVNYLSLTIAKNVTSTRNNPLRQNTANKVAFRISAATGTGTANDKCWSNNCFHSSLALHIFITIHASLIQRYQATKRINITIIKVGKLRLLFVRVYTLHRWISSSSGSFGDLIFYTTHHQYNDTRRLKE